MVNSKLLKNAYIRLYKQLRNYIWPFRVVELIADLEIAVYQAIPNVQDVSRIFLQLRSAIRNVMNEDEDLRFACDEFAKQFENKDDAFMKLTTVHEVITK